jgi:hypothetical protein
MIAPPFKHTGYINPSSTFLAKSMVIEPLQTAVIASPAHRRYKTDERTKG